MKILYVCPHSHYPGHYSYSARNETACLLASGVEVYLLTFEGLWGNETPKTKAHYMVLDISKLPRFLRHWLQSLRTWLPTKWLLMYWEDFVTIGKALGLRKKLGCDIIYLVHGDAFIFIPHIFGFFTRGIRWIIWQISYPIHYPKNIFRRAGFLVMDSIVHTKLWRPMYHISLSRNRFAYVATHPSDYQTYQNGIFADRLFAIPLAHHASTGDFLSKQEARQHLNLPKDALVLLSFGTVHAGKDLATVFKAVAGLPEVVLVQAGKIPPGWDFKLQESGQKELANIIVHNQYISEHEKRFYFYAADAMVLSYITDFQNASMLWEACRFKKPVIVSDSGDLGDPVRKFKIGLLFTPQNADSLGQAIRTFSNLTALQKETMEKNCETFNREYSPERWTKEILTICHKLFQ